MRKIAIQDSFALVDDEDFDIINCFKWRLVKGGNNYYAKYYSRANGKQIHVTMQSLILGFTTNSTHTIDHKDGNGLNNQKYNLRICTKSENCANTSPRKNSSSKYMGVSFHKKSRSWLACIKKNRRTHYLGYFKNEEEAAIAYNEKAILLHGEFARLNQI